MKTRCLLAFTVIAVITLFTACGGPGTTVPSIPSPTPIAPSPTPTASTILVPMGVDYGLKRQCIRGVYPDEANFYVDNHDCPGSSYPTSHNWLTLAEIENFGTFGVGCTGPTNQSVLINGPGSPVTENWQGSSATGYTLELKADYASIPNPCAAPTWTAIPLIDNGGFGGGPFPRPDQFRVQFTATFNRRTVGGGGSHASAEMFSVWNVAGSSTPIHVSLQVEMFWDPTFLCCGIPPGLPPDVVAYASGGTYFIDYDGSKLNPPIKLPLGVTTPITINWRPILAHAIAEKLVPPPVNGWASSSAWAGDSIVGLELKNNIAGSGGGTADLTISNYRETAVIITTP